jgi:hypothetical protein
MHFFKSCPFLLQRPLLFIMITPCLNSINFLNKYVKLHFFIIIISIFLILNLCFQILFLFLIFFKFFYFQILVLFSNLFSFLFLFFSLFFILNIFNCILIFHLKEKRLCQKYSIHGQRLVHAITLKNV